MLYAKFCKSWLKVFNHLPKSKKFEAKDRLRILLEALKKSKPDFQAKKSRKAKLRALEPKREWGGRGKELSWNQVRQVFRAIPF